MNNLEKIKQRLPKTLYNKNAWIGVDFDGTLSKTFQPYAVGKVGEPIIDAIILVQQLLHEGYNIKIFSARFNSKNPDLDAEKHAVKDFLIKYVTKKDLEMTAEKDYDTILIIDDIAVNIERNEGKVV